MKKKTKKDYLMEFLRRHQDEDLEVSMTIGKKTINSNVNISSCMALMENFGMNPHSILSQQLLDELVLSELNEEEQIDFITVEDE